MISLNKSEKKLLYGNKPAGIIEFLFIFIFAGGLFSVLFNLFMMAFTMVMMLIDGEAMSIKALFTDIPWIWFIVFTWIAFGGSTGLITVMAKNK